jgi:hypothetical protein
LTFGPYWFARIDSMIACALFNYIAVVVLLICDTIMRNVFTVKRVPFCKPREKEEKESVRAEGLQKMCNDYNYYLNAQLN